MAVPDFEAFMLPVLRHLGDKDEHSRQEITSYVADHMNISEKDRAELLPSGKQYTLNNRVGWSITYMMKAGLVDRLSRGRYRITDRGLAVLSRNPGEINRTFLEQFPEFIEFKRYRPDKKDKPETGGEDDTLTPEELLERSYETIKQELAQELLDRIMKSSPEFFERLVVDLLVAMGYGGSRRDAGQAIGRSGDEGIDGIIKEDRLGLDAIYIQAKRWQNPVGRREIQQFVGSLEGKRARKGVFITTSTFSANAEAYVTQIEKKIVLIDGTRLSELMIEHAVGVTEESRYVVHRVDSDYFE
ncbi:MAG: restriction endonuclease [Methanomicrobiaceae archaeon]|nr:restriction endonuclease [Methanomicrobiaceae archaeon]